MIGRIFSWMNDFQEAVNAELPDAIVSFTSNGVTVTADGFSIFKSSKYVVSVMLDTEDSVRAITQEVIREIKNGKEEEA